MVCSNNALLREFQTCIPKIPIGRPRFQISNSYSQNKILCCLSLPMRPKARVLELIRVIPKLLCAVYYSSWNLMNLMCFIKESGMFAAHFLFVWALPKFCWRERKRNYVFFQDGKKFKKKQKSNTDNSIFLPPPSFLDSNYLLVLHPYHRIQFNHYQFNLLHH